MWLVDTKFNMAAIFKMADKNFKISKNHCFTRKTLNNFDWKLIFLITFTLHNTVEGIKSETVAIFRDGDRFCYKILETSCYYYLVRMACAKGVWCVWVNGEWPSVSDWWCSQCPQHRLLQPDLTWLIAWKIVY